MTAAIARVLAVVTVLWAAACMGPQPKSDKSQENTVSPPSPPPSVARPSPSTPPSGCTATLSADGERMVVIVRNTGSTSLHLLQAPRMPYVAVEATDHIVLAWSIQPPPADRDLGMVEPLDTVELPAGGELRREATLRLPLQVSSHVRGPERYAQPLPAQVSVVAELGFVSHALDPKARHRQNYPALIADQQICRTSAVTVALATP